MAGSGGKSGGLAIQYGFSIFEDPKAGGSARSGIGQIVTGPPTAKAATCVTPENFSFLGHRTGADHFDLSH